MSVFDYAKKYGKQTFRQKAFSDVDNLIFSLLSYLDYTETSINRNDRTLREIAREYFSRHSLREVRAIGVAQTEAYRMLKICETVPRYANLKLKNYVYDTSSKMQFSAMTFCLTRNLNYIAFEGTDELISGWREDFELASSFPVPSHVAAMRYLDENVHLFGPVVVVGGHSKGGNLALVGTMFMNRVKARKVLRVYNNDGPGLRKREFYSSRYARIRQKYIHIVPDSSVVGVLMRNEKYTVVKSTRQSMLGHAISTWKIDEDRLQLGELSMRSKRLEKTILAWLEEHSDAERKLIIEAVFGTLEGCNIMDTMALKKMKNIMKVARAAKELDPRSKELVRDFAKCVIGARLGK